MKKKPTRGGKREGAGRKAGSGAGRTVTTSSLNLSPELWGRLDALRGELTRSAWIAAKIKNARQATGRARWGTIQYPRPLTPEEIYDYKLEVMDETDTLPTNTTIPKP